MDKKESELYYVICENWSLDSNQWSILLGTFGVILTLIGFIIAYLIYNKQRSDNANDAFEYFESEIPELKFAIEDTIQNLKRFTESLSSDNFVNPVLTASLNDKFLSKINLIDLHRFYSTEKKDKLENFKLFIKDSNFFGDYHSYYTNEIAYFRTFYLEKENIISQWQLLRSNKFFSTLADENERDDYKEFYANWVRSLNQNRLIFNFDDNGNPIALISRKILIDTEIKNLAQNIFPFIQYSEKANEINLISNNIVSAYADITATKLKIKAVFERDIQKFEEILANLKKLIE